MLVRYIWFLLISLGIIGAFVVFTIIVLQGIRTTAESQIADNAQKAVSYTPVQVRATAFQSNLAVAKSILSKQVNYSTIILDISAHLPSGVILENLSLDAKTFGTPMEIRAKARSREVANNLKDSLESSNMFKDVQFKSLTSNDADTTGYFMSVVLQATIDKDKVTQ
jgi:Tfp pilus assembly protein PilN